MASSNLNTNRTVLMRRTGQTGPEPEHTGPCVQEFPYPDKEIRMSSNGITPHPSELVKFQRKKKPQRPYKRWWRPDGCKHRKLNVDGWCKRCKTKPGPITMPSEAARIEQKNKFCKHEQWDSDFVCCECGIVVDNKHTARIKLLKDSWEYDLLKYSKRHTSEAVPDSPDSEEEWAMWAADARAIEERFKEEDEARWKLYEQDYRGKYGEPPSEQIKKRVRSRRRRWWHQKRNGDEKSQQNVDEKKQQGHTEGAAVQTQRPVAPNNGGFKHLAPWLVKTLYLKRRWAKCKHKKLDDHTRCDKCQKNVEPLPIDSKVELAPAGSLGYKSQLGATVNMFFETIQKQVRPEIIEVIRLNIREYYDEYYNIADALKFAIVYDHPDYAHHVLAKSAGSSLLHTSCCPIIIMSVRSQCHQILQYICEYSQSLHGNNDFVDHQGCSAMEFRRAALHTVAESGNLKLLKILVNFGASETLMDRNNYTALGRMLYCLTFRKCRLSAKDSVLSVLLLFTLEKHVSPSHIKEVQDFVRDSDLLEPGDVDVEHLAPGINTLKNLCRNTVRKCVKFAHASTNCFKLPVVPKVAPFDVKALPKSLQAFLMFEEFEPNCPEGKKYHKLQDYYLRDPL